MKKGMMIAGIAAGVTLGAVAAGAAISGRGNSAGKALKRGKKALEHYRDELM